MIEVITKINDLLGAILPLLISIGVIYFVWGVIQYVISDSTEAKTKGKDRIIYGIVGLAIVISVWGLVYLLVDTFVLQEAAPDLTNLVPTTGGQGDSVCEIGTKLQGLLDYVTCIIGKSVIPLIFALAIVMFVWGAINFFFINSGDEAKRTQGKQFMIWGIIALAVMVSIWGLVGMLGSTFGIQNTIPQVRP